MNKTIGFLALSALFLSTGALADSHMPPPPHDQTCREMALEDDVAADKMDRYMAWCLEDLATPETTEVEEEGRDEERPEEDDDRPEEKGSQ